MSITQTQAAVGSATATAGTLVPASPLSITNPGAGQVIVVGVRTVNTSVPTVVLYSDLGSAGAPDFEQLGDGPEWDDAGNDTYITYFWKVATGAETSVQASFNNSSQGTGTASSVLGALGFAGFVGTPTLDQSGVGNTGGPAETAVETSAAMVPTVTQELWVAFAALSNTYSGTPSFKEFFGGFTGTVVTAAGTTQLLAGYWVGSLTAGDNYSPEFTWSTSRDAGMAAATFYDAVSVTASAARASGSGTAQSAAPAAGVSTSPAAAFGWGEAQAAAAGGGAGSVAASAYGSGAASGGTPSAGTSALPASAFGWGAAAASSPTSVVTTPAASAFAWAHSHGATPSVGISTAPASAFGWGGADAGTATAATGASNVTASPASAYGSGTAQAELANVTNIVNCTYATGFAAGGTPIPIPSATPDNLLRVSVVVNRAGSGLPSSPQLPTDNMSGSEGWAVEATIDTDGVGAWSFYKVALGGETEVVLKWTGGLGGSGTSEARILEITNSLGGVPTLDGGGSNAGVGGIGTGANGFSPVFGSGRDEIALATVATDGGNGAP